MQVLHNNYIQSVLYVTRNTRNYYVTCNNSYNMNKNILPINNNLRELCTTHTVLLYII
jgi:hypothetical protein